MNENEILNNTAASEEPTPETSKSIQNEIFDWISALLFALVTIILIQIFSIRVVDVYGDSMLPTLHGGDKLVINHLFYEPEYGDIVVVTKPNRDNHPLIKRVIATEGQVVNIDLEKQAVYINGVKLQEDYILEAIRVDGNIEYPVEVPENCVFVMGDNRNDSLDSRYLEVGMVDERYIAGKVIFRLMPSNKFGSVE